MSKYGLFAIFLLAVVGVNAALMPSSQSIDSPIRVFVFSMPQQSLRQWFSQADHYHSPLIIRELVNNLLKATVNAFNGLWQAHLSLADAIDELSCYAC